MSYIIGCDAHKHYSQFAVYEGDNLRGKQVRVEHERGAIRAFLSEFPEGTPVALESIGNGTGSWTRWKRLGASPCWLIQPKRKR
jgi:hypothetical protein